MLFCSNKFDLNDLFMKNYDMNITNKNPLRVMQSNIPVLKHSDFKEKQKLTYLQKLKQRLPVFNVKY